jgi:threonine/homoserine efflux transporter RhtA
MATTSVNRRIIRVPVQAQQAKTEIFNKMNTLKLAGTNIFVTYAGTAINSSEMQLVQFEGNFTAGNDAALVALMPAWATLAGTALLDTEVSSFTAGH